MSMLILDFFTWWYSTGWLKTVNDLKRKQAISIEPKTYIKTSHGAAITNEEVISL
jgi:hypothetical protein